MTQPTRFTRYHTSAPALQSVLKELRKRARDHRGETPHFNKQEIRSLVAGIAGNEAENRGKRDDYFRFLVNKGVLVPEPKKTNWVWFWPERAREVEADIENDRTLADINADVARAWLVTFKRTRAGAQTPGPTVGGSGSRQTIVLKMRAETLPGSAAYTPPEEPGQPAGQSLFPPSPVLAHVEQDPVLIRALQEREMERQLPEREEAEEAARATRAPVDAPPAAATIATHPAPYIPPPPTLKTRLAFMTAAERLVFEALLCLLTPTVVGEERVAVAVNLSEILEAARGESGPDLDACHAAFTRLTEGPYRLFDLAAEGTGTRHDHQAFRVHNGLDPWAIHVVVIPERLERYIHQGLYEWVDSITRLGAGRISYGRRPGSTSMDDLERFLLAHAPTTFTSEKKGHAQVLLVGYDASDAEKKRGRVSAIVHPMALGIPDGEHDGAYCLVALPGWLPSELHPWRSGQQAITAPSIDLSQIEDEVGETNIKVETADASGVEAPIEAPTAPPEPPPPPADADMGEEELEFPVASLHEEASADGVEETSFEVPPAEEPTSADAELPATVADATADEEAPAQAEASVVETADNPLVADATVGEDSMEILIPTGDDLASCRRRRDVLERICGMWQTRLQHAQNRFERAQQNLREEEQRIREREEAERQARLRERAELEQRLTELREQEAKIAQRLAELNEP